MNNCLQLPLTSRHEELKERARLLLEAARRDVSKKGVVKSPSAGCFETSSSSPTAGLHRQSSKVGNKLENIYGYRYNYGE